MFDVTLSDDAEADIQRVPLVIRARVAGVLERLKRWPTVSGHKPMRGSLKGTYRIRTGDWRIVFSVSVTEKLVTIKRIANRRDVYED
jgi:mRNA interferase RelE/StbE